MLIQKFNIRKFFIVLTIFIIAFSSKAFSQENGSLFMLQNNFHAHILNPSYLRSDNAIVISIAGFAGATFRNSSNFKISDLIVKDKLNSLVFDFEHFYNARNSNSYLKNQITIPEIYISIPFREGKLTIYLREQIQSSLEFNMEKLDFYVGTPNHFESYNINNVNYSGIGYRELAVGYSQKINDNINIGIRGKILFGGAFADLENGSYEINKTNIPDEVSLTYKGTASASLPIEITLDKNNKVTSVNSKYLFVNYLTSYRNPGLGIDVGATVNFNEKSWISMSVTDIGTIWFRHKTANVNQNEITTFSQTEISDLSVNNGNNNYIEPYGFIKLTKDKHKTLYQPVVDYTKFKQSLVPKTSLHYQYNFSKSFSMGATNQSLFHKNNYLNVLTISALQKQSGFSVFESINLFGLNRVTVGTGFQYDGKFLQIFASTDNLLTIYRPIKNREFSLTLGICLLLNKTKEKETPQGKFSPFFPFYKNKGQF